ncbi:MAG: Holliday junction branch migration protein RuvA, partial [Roseomonas sp.]|nr:Holliday junction branch migration protein RuvA [Roseomonas sp.]
QKWAVGRTTPGEDGEGAIIAAPDANSIEADAISALVNLGLKRPEATTAITRAAKRLGAEATLNDLIRDGLKEMAR